ncbi:hypothetical protein AB2L27_02785 [Kineococcus sp. LSe6-4]|uniref:Uncharacterized protein n=1 Tax=Kineococcus halophytocola TaxID=3234027 RepID=A0ABV4GX79_9ACTN
MTDPRTDAGPTPLPRRRGGAPVEAAAPTPPPAPARSSRPRHRAEGPGPEEPLLPAAEPAAAAPAPAVPAPRPAPVPPPVQVAPEPRVSPPAGDFYGPPAPARTAFNPGNASPFQVPRTEAVPRRAGRNPVRTLTTWAAVLVALAIGGKYGYPVVMEQVHRKEIAALTADLEAVGAAQASYVRLYGTYATTVDALGAPRTVSRVSVVTATGSGYCLRGESVAGGVVRYASPARGVTGTPCG